MTEHRKQLLMNNINKAKTFVQIYTDLRESHKAKPILRNLAQTYNIHYVNNEQRFIIPGDNGARPIDCGYNDLKECIATILES